MGKTVIRAKLAEEIYKQIGLSQSESAEIVSTILEEISARLEAGETVKISSFGSFSVRHKNERIGRNPKTGQEVPITQRRVLSFRPSDTLRERLNEK
ncbi:MAG: integration host factor subunit alpha [Candidatus Puniceispirillales bacterium]